METEIVKVAPTVVKKQYEKPPHHAPHRLVAPLDEPDELVVLLDYLLVRLDDTLQVSVHLGLLLKHSVVLVVEVLVYSVLRCHFSFLSHIASWLRQSEARLVHRVVRCDFICRLRTCIYQYAVDVAVGLRYSTGTPRVASYAKRTHPDTSGIRII